MEIYIKRDSFGYIFVGGMYFMVLLELIGFWVE